MTTLWKSPIAKPGPLLGDGDYVRFASIVQEHSGLYFPEKRRDELERGVQRGFAASTCADLNEYYNVLQDPDRGAVHFERLLNALTVCETHFFRHAAQFDALCSRVLPEIIDRRRQLRTLRIWSAGCASGEEPYSIAMLLREMLPDVDEWSITILGTDVNTQGLDRARRGLYGDWAFREDRAKERRPRYFQQQGSRYELCEQVRRMVTFRQLNLNADCYPAYETNTRFMDLIFCRNVTIYFEEMVTRQITDRFYECLVDGGWLVVGHSEHSLNIYRRFRAHNFKDAILYQREEPFLEFPSELPAMPEKTVETVPWFAPIPRPLPDPLPVPTPAPAQALSDDVHPPSSLLSALQEDPESSNPLERAQELLEYGYSEKARDLLLEMVPEESNHAVVCTMLGQANANLGQWEDAEHWCRQAVGIDILALDAYYTMALVLQHQGFVGQAIVAMKKVVYIDRHSVLGHFGLASLYQNNGQFPQALKSLDNAHRLLEALAGDQVIPGSDGITVGSLRDTIVRLQQQWSIVVDGQ